MAFILPVSLGLVAALFVLIVSGEVFYLFYWRKRPSACPRLNSVTVAPVNEGEQVEVRDQSRAAVVIDVTCAEYQIGILQQDLVEKLFPSLSSVSHEATHHTMVGPPRMLFTIKEETKEELEGLDIEGKGGGGGRSRRSSRSKSMSDIPLSPPRPPHPDVSVSSLVTTPFVTPLSSPDVFSSSSPYGTPTRSFSPLVHHTSTPPSSSSRSQSHSASPKQLRKTSCRIMYDYPNPKPPAPCSSIICAPLAPPSPTRPTFSFLASRNVALSHSRSSSGGSLVDISSPVVVKVPAAHASPPPPPSRRPLFEHLATSPIHKQAECLIKAPSPLRSCTYEYDDDYDDYDDRSSPSQLSRQSSSNASCSSPDRSPNFYCTPPPSFVPDEILVAPSSKGSVFNRRRGGGIDISPLSSPSDGDSPYASPLLVLPSSGEGDSEACSPSRPPLALALASGNGIIKDEESADTVFLRPEGGMPPIVLPTKFSFQAARSKAQSFLPSTTTPSVVLSSEVV